MKMPWLGNRDKKQKYQDALMELLCNSDMVYYFIWDLNKDELFFNPAAQDAFDFAQGRPSYSRYVWETAVFPPDRLMVTRVLDELKTGRVGEEKMRYRLHNKQGERMWVQAHCRCVADEEGLVELIVGSLLPESKEKRTDHLTGLMNHTQFAEDFEENRELVQNGYVVVFGLDDFKTVNDRYGREHGNRILKLFAANLEEKMGGKNNIYHLEGDKFCVNLPEKNQMAVQKLYNSVCYAFRKACDELQDKMYISVSAGAAAYPLDSKDFNEVCQFAETALNAAKRAGKRSLVFFSYEEYEQYLADVGMREDLHACVQNGMEGFELYYQPQISMENGRVEGAEALLRWSSRRHGRITPAIFIPLLEKHGLICQVGRWVIDQALCKCKKWREEIPDFCISINLSYIQLEKDDIAGILLNALNRYQLPGSAVLLELTESAQLNNYHFYNETLSYLNRIGVMVAIDDFGTGYSSLGYFKELNINQIKIDRCFVIRIQESEYDYRLIQFIIELAHSINVSVCVEGVETAEELSALMPLQPDYIQGYYFGRPVSSDFFEENFVYNWTGAGEDLTRKVEDARYRALVSQPGCSDGCVV